MCGYGIHLQKRPHKFDLLYQSNPKEWHFWMYDQGWGEVLDYIGVEWRPEPEQITMDDIIKNRMKRIKHPSNKESKREEK